MKFRLPIVPHQRWTLNDAESAFCQSIATRLLHDHSELEIDPLFKELVADELTDAPSLHVDDLTEIRCVQNFERAFLQERARLRAVEGDMLATSMPPIPGYEDYCCQTLGMGSVQWIRPRTRLDPLRLAEACWEDRDVRRDLVHAIRSTDLHYVHPHMGSRAAWELALLLSQASHRPVKVIAPPPTVTQFVNDKGSFNTLVQSMFGLDSTPACSVAWNMASVAKRLQSLDSSAKYVAIKLPNSTNGAGNLLIPMTHVHGKALADIDAMLHERLQELHYESGDELLVTLWVDHIVASPSAQLWIPPPRQGPPLLEGVFLQTIEGNSGRFGGFSYAELPDHLLQQVTKQCLQLALVFQLIGYVGRCSFDLLLVGQNFDDANLKFIECNGRWGGTSLPMTLMNQVFGDWKSRPFATSTVKILPGNPPRFENLISDLAEDFYARTHEGGNWIVYNPQRLAERSELPVVSLQQNWQRPLSESLDQLLDKIHASMTTGK